MRPLFLILSLIIVTFLINVDIALISWNKGHDTGYSSGYTQAIIDGKVIIECHFQCRPGRSRASP